MPKEPKKITVDLKWGCWSQDKGTWDEYAKGAWEKMRAAYLGKGPPVDVHTSPRKEIRHGSVEIFEGEAYPHFYTEWDDLEALASNWMEEDEPDYARFLRWLRDNVPNTEGGTIGADEMPGKITARTFPELMKKIDDVEARLLEKDGALYTELDAHIDAMLIPRITGRRKFPPLPSHGFIEEDEDE